MPFLRTALLFCFALVAASACTQDEGESCQVNNDCGDGLLCVVATGSLRGTCRTSEDAVDAGDDDGTIPDSGNGDFGDASFSDAAADASSDDDAGR